MRWYSAYYFEVKVHYILIRVITLFNYYNFSDLTLFYSFPDNSSYSFHLIALKLGGQLDQEVVLQFSPQTYRKGIIRDQLPNHFVFLIKIETVDKIYQ